MFLKIIIVLLIVNVVNGFIDFKLWVFELILKCYEGNVFEFVGMKVKEVYFNFELDVKDFELMCLVVKVSL